MSFLRVLVLDFDENAKIATCFDMKSKNLVKIQWESEEKPRKGQFIKYSENAKIENGVVIAPTAKVEEATKEDCVKIFKGGRVKFGAWIGFSDNPLHKTYDRKLAFCDWYGLLDNSEHQKTAISLREETRKRLFTAFVVVHDLNYLEHGSQLFKVSHIGAALDRPEFRDADEESLRKLDEFEEKLVAEGDVSCKTVFRNRVLILDYSEISNIAICFDRKSRSTVKIRWKTDENPSPGQFIKYPKDAKIENGIVMASPPDAEIENAAVEDCVQIVNGKLKISAWIGFSDKPHHKTFDRNLAYCDWYGLIDNSHLRERAITLGEKSDARIFRAHLAVNDLNFLENHTQLFKVCTIKRALGGPDMIRGREILEELDEFEEALEAKKLEALSDDCLVSPSHPETSIEASREIETPSTSVPPDSNKPPPCHLCTMGVAMTSTSDGDLVIWMCDLKAIAMLRRTCLGFESIQLGSAFESIVQKQKKETVFEVTVIRKTLETPLPFQLHENSEEELEAEFVVDLCTPNFDFNFWTIYTGIAVLNTEGVGMVTTADRIKTPSGEKKQFYQVMRTYQGDPRASRMVGMCRLEEQRVPRRVVDGNYQGFETVLQFHWKLYELKGFAEISEKI